MRGQIDNIRIYEYHRFLWWVSPSLYSISLSPKSPSARFPTSSDYDMTEPTHIIDTEGEVIIFLKCLESLFAPWNEDVADPEPLKSHGDVQKNDSGENAT
jgi:hypothetical protein